jgi:hypothetical protein
MWLNDHRFLPTFSIRLGGFEEEKELFLSLPGFEHRIMQPESYPLYKLSYTAAYNKKKTSVSKDLELNFPILVERNLTPNAM